MRVFLSLFFWFYLIATLTLFWFAVAIPWLLVAPFDPRRRFAHWYATFWATHFHRVSPFWDVVVQHNEKIPDDRAVLLVANHQSSADILVLFSLRKQFKWVAKRELFFIPFLGWMMAMAGYVAIRRGDAASREEMMGRCERHLRAGSSLLMFPEGTRSETRDMRPFKRGAFVLACTTKVPVIPVVVHGTRNTLPRNSLIFRHRTRVNPIVHVMDPVDPADYDYDAKRLMHAVREMMVARREEIRQQDSAELSVAG